MEFKSWQAQDYYNEYLDLKFKISDIVTELEYCKKHEKFNYMVEKWESELEPLVKRLKFVLQELRLHGVSMEDLILLSVGVEV
jgi:hypothetical protein